VSASRVRRFAAATAVLLSGGCSSHVGPASLRTPADLLNWIAHHRSDVGLVTIRGDSTAPLVALNPDSLFPLGSTKKVLILGGYAGLVAASSLDPQERVPLTAVEHWYWPGTDGGAHPNAVQDWRSRGLLVGDSVPLSAVADGMIRWSDNAAADYLLSRVGRRAVSRFAHEMGMSSQQPLAPILGYAAWSTQPDTWLAATADKRAELADVATGELRRPIRLALPSLTRQRELSETDCAGTPQEWARLMHVVATGDTMPAAAAKIMRTVLGWPLVAFPANRRTFTDYETKGGSLPGVLTEASYIRPVGQAAGTSIAIFFRNLPQQVDDELKRTFVHQAFERSLATSEQFLRQVEKAFDNGTPG
jgi:D-alanyl-D-alanine carboxypeptidase